MIEAILLAIMATIGVPGDDKPTDPGTALVEEASVLLRSGKPAEAMVLLDPAILHFEKTYAGEKRKIFCATSGAETLLYLASVAATKRDAIAIEPGWCDALFMKGYALIDRGNIPGGVVYLEKAIGMAPYHAHYLNELGYALQTQKQWDQALGIYQQAEDAARLAGKEFEKEERGRALRGRGFIYIEQGKLDDAEKVYRAALKLDPKDEKAKGELDYIHEQRGRSN